MLVREYVLDPGERIPWHHHTEVTDRFFCLQGTVLVQTREPGIERRLAVGDSTTVEPPTVHQVSNSTDEVCRFLLVQGLGRHDFNPDSEH